MSNQKLSNETLKTILSSTIEEKKYDLDLACRVVELLNDLKAKIQEDLDKIDSIENQLKDIKSVETISLEIREVAEELRNSQSKVDSIIQKLQPKS